MNIDLFSLGFSIVSFSNLCFPCMFAVYLCGEGCGNLDFPWLS